MIAVLDGGLGNIGSVANMLRKLGAAHLVTADPTVVATADGIILPGVGSFDRGSRALTDSGLREALHERVRIDGVPFLGICLGMQLLGRGSDEGVLPGLGWLDADVRRLTPGDPALPVPHMGWNQVEPTAGIDLVPAAPRPRYYFVHSFRMVCDDPADVAATTTYGEAFTAAVQRGNIVGVQFHPEKSHAFGMALLERWVARSVDGGEVPCSVPESSRS